MNRTVLIFTGFAAAVLAAAGAGYWVATPRMQTTSAGASAVAPSSAPAKDSSGRKILYWHDPMVPQQKFDRPGKSPFMDMQLVPVYADEDAGGDAVSIDPRVVQNLGIRTAEAVMGLPERRFEAVGGVAWNERAVVVLQARAAGFVEKLYARAPLDAVAKGQPLVELLVPDWAAAQEEYLLLRRSESKDTEVLATAARQRLLLLGMSEEQILRVEKTGRPQTRITLRSPISGVIAELGVREGMSVAPGAMLFRLVDLSSVWVNAEVPEAQAGWLQPGGAVEVRVPAWPDRVFRGKVSAILPELNAATRTVRARIEIANPGAKLKPGMFATLGFIARGSAKALWVPSEAIIRTGERSLVIVAEGEGRFRQAEVEPGFEWEGKTEVRKGLAAGDKVVVSGQFLLDSEASLRSAAIRMEAAPVAAVHKAAGRLVRVDAKELTISHGAIESAGMGPMTMVYQAPQSGVPAGLKAGDEVRFEFVSRPDGEFQVTRIERVAAGDRAHGDAK
ncbi:MAG: efflux RND transporter periplasmic adaptor subunit [Burkholderiales bacterium]